MKIFCLIAFVIFAFPFIVAAQRANDSVCDEPGKKEYPPSLFVLMQKIEDLKAKRW